MKNTTHYNIDVGADTSTYGREWRLDLERDDEKKESRSDSSSSNSDNNFISLFNKRNNNY